MVSVLKFLMIFILIIKLFKGMALNFILVGLQEILPYDKLYESLITLLYVGSQCDLNYRNLDPNKKLSHFGLCAVQYCFDVIWRIILQLPPSVKSLQLLSNGDVRQFDNSKALHSCIWITRIANNKWFYIWVKDSLTKLLQNDANVKPDNLLKSVIKTANSVTFNIQLLKHLMIRQFSCIKCGSNSNEIVAPDGMPLLYDMFTLEVLCAKTCVTLDSCYNLNESSPPLSGSPSVCGTNIESKQASIEILPTVLSMISCNLSCARSSLIHQMTNDDVLQGIVTVPKLLNAYNSIIKITSSKCSGKLSHLTLALAVHLPRNLVKILDKWNMIPVDVSHWRTEHSSSPIPSESYIMGIQSHHFMSISASNSSPFNSNVNLKHLTNTLLKFAEDLFQ
jgi:hypothetical protein